VWTLELRSPSEYITIFNSGGIIANLTFADNSQSRRQFAALAPVRVLLLLLYYSE